MARSLLTASAVEKGSGVVEQAAIPPSTHPVRFFS